MIDRTAISYAEDSNYSETIGSFRFFFKDGTTNFSVDVANTNIFKYFKYKAKLLENKIAQPAPNAANGVLKNSTITVPLKYLSNFWKSLKMPLINCKEELKLKWTTICVLSAAGNDNVNDIVND